MHVLACGMSVLCHLAGGCRREQLREGACRNDLAGKRLPSQTALTDCADVIPTRDTVRSVCKLRVVTGSRRRLMPGVAGG